MSDTALPDVDSTVGELKNGLDSTTDKLQDGVSRARSRAKAALDQGADRVQAGISRARSRAKTALDQGADQVQEFADTIGPFVLERPYTALALAAAGGLVLGLLFFGRAPRIVYVKPRD